MINKRIVYKALFSVFAAIAAFSINGFRILAGNLEWRIEEEGKSYWYEGGVRQGTINDPQGVLGDDGSNRGREIYDPTSNGWYWLDSMYNGAKAVNKEVWMPYVFRGEDTWSEEQIQSAAGLSGDMAAQVADAMHCHGDAASGKWGKWVRYDSNGAMIKGWYKVQGSDVNLYPKQAGNIYYYDPTTGLMAKGQLTIDGVSYHFNELTGVLDSNNPPDYLCDGSSSDNSTVSLADCKIGDVVCLGTYEQDNNLGNGKESIRWRVIGSGDGKALLLSENALDFMSYHSDGNEYNVTWETCSLRSWLNNDFYNSAFDGSEQGIILASNLSNESNQKSMFGAGNGGGNTVDKVFCLSQTEVRNYFSFNDWRSGSMYGFCEGLIGPASEYAANKGANNLVISENDYSGNLQNKGYSRNSIGKTGCNWWLRSPGNIQYRACYVDPYGKAGETVCDFASTQMAVRPAIWVKTK